MNEDTGTAIAITSAAPRRKRRSTAEIRDLILDAALVEFGRNGYANTATAAIARRAGVAEALIFTHFTSKANLFRKAVFKPLDDHFARFMRGHALDPANPEARERESRAFVSDLLGFIRTHAGLFKSLVVNAAYDPGEEGASGLSGLQDYFDAMSAREEANLAGDVRVSPGLIARISFATLLGCVLYDDWLFPDGLASDSAIHEGVCDFIMDGLKANPGRRRA